MTEPVLFSVNTYDHEGDAYDTGIFLHFGDTRIKVAENFKGFEDFLISLTAMKSEIGENCERSGRG
jgi:hypothetical protein